MLWDAYFVSLVHLSIIAANNITIANVVNCVLPINAFQNGLMISNYPRLKSIPTLNSFYLPMEELHPSILCPNRVTAL
jgi:hypothetical protein